MGRGGAKLADTGSCGQTVVHLELTGSWGECMHDLGIDLGARSKHGLQAWWRGLDIFAILVLDKWGWRVDVLDGVGVVESNDVVATFDDIGE
jgi:hypothetical protein